MPPKKRSKKRQRKAAVPEDLLDDDRREEILMTFEHALKKGEATLTVSKAKKSWKTLGVAAKSDEIQSFFGREEALNEIDKAFFLRFAASRILQMEQAHKAFGLVDKDNKGFVVLEDLQRVAQDLGEDLTEDDLEEMIALVDRSGDGLLSPKDFVRIAKKINL